MSESNHQGVSLVPEELYQILFMEGADGIFVMSPQGRFLAVNPQGIEFSGYSAADLLGMNNSDLIFPEDLSRNPISLTELLMGETVTKERNLRRKDGSLLPVEFRFRRLSDGNILGVARDITERKWAEMARDESRRFLMTVLDTIPVRVFWKDRNSIYLGCNRPFALDTGFQTTEEAVGKSDYDSVAEQAELYRADDQAVMTSGVPKIGYEEPQTLPDGERWLRTSKVPLRNEQGEIIGVLGTYEDITASKLAEQKNQKLQQQLLQAQKMESVGRLAGGVAHDFNNMLTAILGHVELALMECQPSDPIHADLTEIGKAARRSAALTSQLLAFARKQNTVPRVLDLNATVEGMLKILRRLIGEDIDLVWQPGAELPSVKVDPSQIDQILANLCVNARDAIEGVGKVTIRTDRAMLDQAGPSISPESPVGEFVLLAVSDNGCGMDLETRKKLFEPFFTTKAIGKGTGLGLATVYGIVKQNAGFIDVYSEPGKGSIFNIYFPVHAGKGESMVAECGEVTCRGSETILLVEDEPAILNIGKRILEGLGYRVLSAGTPSEALRIAQVHGSEIRLLVTDVIMPEMNGQDLSKRLLSMVPGLRCLFMSGYTTEIIAHHGLMDEAVNFIQKPFSQKGLGEKVRKVLDCA